MLKEQTDFEMLGAEALPGGLAEILRTLQPACEPVQMVRKIPAERGMRGFFARRKKQPDVAA